MHVNVTQFDTTHAYLSITWWWGILDCKLCVIWHVTPTNPNPCWNHTLDTLIVLYALSDIVKTFDFHTTGWPSPEELNSIFIAGLPSYNYIKNTILLFFAPLSKKTKKTHPNAHKNVQLYWLGIRKSQVFSSSRSQLDSARTLAGGTRGAWPAGRSGSGRVVE